MKRIIIAVGMWMALSSVQALADNTSTKEVKHAKIETVTKSAQQMHAEQLVSRLHQIHDLAITGKLSAAEKKSYRAEVKSIQQELKQMDGFYVYLSLTAILIILLLIILL